MICLPCREAGRSNAAANNLGYLAADDTAYSKARELHAECEGGQDNSIPGAWCFCQHKTGRVLNLMRTDVPGIY